MAETLDRLFYRLAPSLYRYAYSIVHHQSEAEEIVQDVFCKLAAKIPEELTDAYVYRAVRNRSLDALRRLKRTTERLEMVKSQMQTGESDLFESGLEPIREAVSSLKQDYREAIVLRIFCGMTLSEVAVIQGVSINTTASRYRYALEQLSRQLSKNGGAPL